MLPILGRLLTCLLCCFAMGTLQLEVLRASPTVTEVDITGGAPELHEQFRYLVREIRAMNISVIDRCNLTVLYEPGQEDLPEFLAEQGVRIVASLPCYSQGNVNKQVPVLLFAPLWERHFVMCVAVLASSVARVFSNGPSKRCST